MPRFYPTRPRRVSPCLAVALHEPREPCGLAGVHPGARHALERPRPAAQIGGEQRIQVEKDIGFELLAELGGDQLRQRLDNSVRPPPAS